MKGHFLTYGLLLLGSFGFGQVRIDSIERKLLLVPETVPTDSIDSHVYPHSYKKVDSIREDFNKSADSLKRRYENALLKINAQTNKASNSIDSLQRLGLSAGKYSKALDSLNQLRALSHSQFSSKLETLKARTTAQLEGIDMPAEYKVPLQRLTNKIQQLVMNDNVIKIPELNVSGFSLPRTGAVGDLTSQAGDFVKLGDDVVLPKIDAPNANVKDLSEQAGRYQEDIQNVTQGNLNDVKALPQAIEDQVAKLDGIQEVQKQSGVIDQHKSQIAELSQHERGKAKALALAKKAATDHFAGKQQQLKAAMEKISKYKQKYSSVKTIKDLPKRPPNAMKGKPLVERLTPGLYFQYQRKGAYLLDANPYVGYKISGRFVGGLGWNHRYAYDNDSRRLTSNSRVYGPRAYFDSRLGKGFIAHLEGEAMNAFVPSTLIGNPDTGHREWVWSFMTGLKKEYKIYKNLKGTAIIQYNWLNRYYKAPYVDRLNSRIGFEYTIKKAPQKKSKNK